MGKILAIKGHPTRGKEVIKLLEMMGGYADDLIDNGTDEKYAYFILKDENNVIDGFPIDKKDEFDFDAQIFTLEGFWEKYPFKIGDKVMGGHGNSLTIKSMSWSEDCETMIYDFKETEDVLFADDLLKWNVNYGGLKLDKNINMNIEFDLTKYSYEVKDGKLIIEEKKSKYPTTYEECIALMHLQDSIVEGRCGYEWRLVSNLQKLLLCRDAYWKIAGEEMGLGKPWEPDWNDSTPKYTIVVIGNDLVKHYSLAQNFILAFPTEEMRDAFYENFKKEIEQCKELL